MYVCTEEERSWIKKQEEIRRRKEEERKLFYVCVTQRIQAYFYRKSK